MSNRRNFLKKSSLGLMAVAALPLAAGTSCEDLSKLALDKATIATAQSVAAGSFTPPQGTPVNVATGFCRVALTLKPSTDSDIRTLAVVFLEALVPFTEKDGAGAPAGVAVVNIDNGYGAGHLAATINSLAAGKGRS